MLLFLKYNSLINWINGHLLTCPFKQHFGLDCPGCGFQRSVMTLIHGDVQASFKLYPASIPVVALFLFFPLHLKFDFKAGTFLIKLLYISIAILIVLNYIYKIYTHKLY